MSTNFSKADRLVDQCIEAGLQALGNDVKKRAIILAPYAKKKKNATFKKHLRSTGNVEVNTGKDTVTISFNTPYARRRHYENNLHPATRKYLTTALKSIKSVKKYFKPIN